MSKPLLVADLLIVYVGRTGFEPATPWSQTRYSTGLNYLPSLLKHSRAFKSLSEERAVSSPAVREGFEPSVQL